MRQGWAWGGQNLGHLSFFFNKPVFMSFSDTVFIFRHSYSCADFNGKPLQVPSLNDYCGKHCALITSVDKPSRVRQLIPYPTLPYLNYPTLPYPTPPHPTPPHPTPPLPYPIPLPYHTLPHLYLNYPTL